MRFARGPRRGTAGSVDALVRPAFVSAAPGQAIGYGPLVPDPNRILSLPVGSQLLP
nr:hypothetical protein JVH1_6672 [Rhodococcus sp. JVH1]